MERKGTMKIIVEYWVANTESLRSTNVENGAAMLKGLFALKMIRKKDEITRCVVVLPTTPHSALNTNTVAKP
ncbi:hypothetical protein TNCV_5047661 [Trichonephila clavipes]|nr:hypothetical protein TNCV_5047661 [Trichonephila clavipes]